MFINNIIRDFSDNFSGNYNNTEKDFCGNKIMIILMKAKSLRQLKGQRKS